jgi:hypothetical protein
VPEKLATTKTINPTRSESSPVDPQDTESKMRSLRNTSDLLRGLTWAVVLASLASSPVYAKKNKNGVGPGNELVYYYAASPLDPPDNFPSLGLSSVQSNGTDSKQLVFHDARIDLSLTGCSAQYDVLDGTADNEITGVLVLQPKSNKNPYVATLTFWFDAPLNHGDVVTHRFYMDGWFQNLSDWPPADKTRVYFDNWEVAAENKRAQTKDCDDEDGPGLDPFTIEVTHE